MAHLRWAMVRRVEGQAPLGPDPSASPSAMTLFGMCLGLEHFRALLCSFGILGLGVEGSQKVDT